MLVLAADEPGPDLKGVHHVMTAACVVFSFGGLEDKLGQPMLSIHTPVPGYEAALEKVLNRTFTAMQVGIARHYPGTSSESNLNLYSDFVKHSRLEGNSNPG